jgi:hypothetical protein
MKFCLVVPEICRGQVHGARKERRRIRRIRIIIIIIITRYDYIRGAILHFQNFQDVCHFQNGCQNTA